MRKHLLLLLLTFAVCLPLLAKEKATKTVLMWPKDNPVIQATFGQFNAMSSYQKSYLWTVEAEVENLTEKPFPSTYLTLVFYDKDNVQIGTSSLTITEGIAPHGKLRQQVSFNTSGKPARLVFASKEVSVSADGTAIKKVQVSVRSTPSGADMSIDGQLLGVTPKVLRIPVGSHTLVLTKAGYTKVEYPFEVGEHDGNGGLIEIELGTNNDIVELRDGTSVAGDVISIDPNILKMNVGDKPIEYPRNMVKRITMVQREVQTPTPQATPAAQAPSK